MPERQTAFAVNAPLWEVWAFVRDVHALCTCIPGVEQVRLVDDRTAELTVKEKIGVVPLVLALTAHIDSEDPPHSLRAVATAEHLTMEIDVALQESGSGTRMLGLIRVKGTGPLERVVDSLFEKRASERAAQFAEHLERRFGALPRERAAVPAGAAAPPRGIGQRIGAWLRALWRRIAGRDM
ncbi:MAG: hypothetical protein J0H00_12320 [Burkholderiales bacterium]|nr:hypothetical protein [Burkholderiales bacterium]